MKNILAALAITAFTATMAVAQTSTGTGAGATIGANTDTTGTTTTDPSTTGNAGTTSKTISPRRADAKKMNLDECTAMMQNPNAGSDRTSCQEGISESSN